MNTRHNFKNTVGPLLLGEIDTQGHGRQFIKAWRAIGKYGQTPRSPGWPLTTVYPLIFLPYKKVLCWYQPDKKEDLIWLKK